MYDIWDQLSNSPSVHFHSQSFGVHFSWVIRKFIFEYLLEISHGSHASNTWHIVMKTDTMHEQILMWNCRRVRNMCKKQKYFTWIRMMISRSKISQEILIVDNAERRHCTTAFQIFSVKQIPILVISWFCATNKQSLLFIHPNDCWFIFN